MAKRRTKKRTHVGAHKPAATGEQPLNAQLNSNKIPKSMVIRIGAGEVGPSISQLVLDVRKMMEPHTAIKLQERKSNKLKDYTTMAGPLGVTQLLLFSRNADSGSVTLRIARCPRGPTLHFRVKKYSLCKDIRKSMKRPKTPTKEHLNPPLLVMNNFSTPPPADHPAGTPHRAPPHEALIISMFQSLFPAISAQRTPLSTIRRVLLLNRIPKSAAKDIPEDERSDSDYLLDLRHYSISTKPVGLSRAVRRLNTAERLISKSSFSPAPRPGRGSVPNLGKLEDISEYMLDPSGAASGYTSESEVEDDAEVEILPTSTAAKNPTKKRRVGPSGPEKHSVKLTEIGPRMTLELVKIEEGLADGKVLYHAFNKKTRKEEKELELRWEERRREKDRRRKEQEENVRRKKAAKGVNGGGGADGEEEDEDGDMSDVSDDEGGYDGRGEAEAEDGDMWDDDDDDDDDM